MNRILMRVATAPCRPFCEPVGGARLRINVADTGRGVRPEHHLPLLFTPFERLDADQSDVEGTGLGLAL